MPQDSLWVKWKELLYGIVITKEWAVFINLIRFLTFIVLVIAVYLLWKEIETVKILGSDPCRICNEMVEGWVCAYVGN